MNNKILNLAKTTPLRRLFLIGVIFYACLSGKVALANCDVVEYFNIPEQALDSALLIFAQQAKVSVLFPGQEFQNIKTNSLQGDYCKEDALRLLLSGLDVEGLIDNNNQLIIRLLKPSEISNDANENITENQIEKNSLANTIKSFLTTLFQGNTNRENDSEQSTDKSNPLQEITVTGSRITRSGMETPTPVTSVSSEELSSLSPDLLIEAMTLLPQFLNNSTPATIGSSTGSLGASFLNLRGIGQNRTLVLLDGRRVAPSNRLGTPDIATLPQTVISHMEIVTGGASAAYGSDAVSGVVNYLLDTDFVGVKGNIQSGISSRDDNQRTKWSLTFGQDINTKTHLLLALNYFEAESVESYADRNWYQNWGTVDINGRGNPRIVAADVHSRLYTAGGLIRLPGSSLDMLHFIEGGQPSNFQDGSLIGETRQVGGTGFYGNIGSKEEDQTGQGSLYPNTERKNLFLYLDHNFNSKITGFTQFIYGKNDINFIGAGAHQETDSWHATIFEDNAYLPDSIRQTMTLEGLDSFPLYRYSSRQDLSRSRGVQENTSRSLSLGLKGDIDSFRINTYYQYSDNKSVYKTQDFPRLDRLYKAMDAVIDPSTGATVCRSTLTFPNDNCIPANPFGPGSMSQSAIDYILEGDMYRLSYLTQHFAEFTIDTELFNSRKQGAVSVATGLTYRQESFDQSSGPQSMVELSVLPAEQEGYKGLPDRFVGPYVLQFSGIGDLSIDGSFNVWEIFGESIIPLIKDRPFFQSLDISTAFRYADYSGSGGVKAWKTGIDWRLHDSIRFRLTRSRDTRAATLSERFDRSGGGTTAYDPLTDTSYTFSQVVGGNPQVAPELADTWTAGIVFQPLSAPGFAFSVDWYDVKIDDYITLLGTQRIINDCFAGVEELCQQINRNPVTNQINFVENVYLNVAQARVKGVDFELSHHLPVSFFSKGNEELNLRLFASFLKENSFTNAGEATRDNAGTVDLPDFSATAILDYHLNNFKTEITARYINDRVQYSDPIPLGLQLDNNKVDSLLNLNLRLSYDWQSQTGNNYSFYFTVSNLSDNAPPVVASWSNFFGASGFISELHDPIGRRYTLGFNFLY